MKKITLVIFTLLFSFSLAFADFGFPTFDFSNLVSAIESISQAVKFYNESVKQAKEYKERLEKLGKNFSEETIMNFFNNFKNGEDGYKNVLGALENLKDTMNDETENIELMLKTFDSNLNEYLGIDTNGAISNIGEKINAYISPDGIKNILGDDLEKVKKSIEEARSKKEKLMSEFQEKKEQLDKDIETLKSEIDKAESDGSESQVALELLSLKATELQFLRDERQNLEEQYALLINEIDTSLDSFLSEYERLQKATETLIANLENASIIDDKTADMLSEINSYKPKVKFTL